MLIGVSTTAAFAARRLLMRLGPILVRLRLALAESAGLFDLLARFALPG
jgi:hypothetical protein